MQSQREFATPDNQLWQVISNIFVCSNEVNTMDQSQQLWRGRICYHSRRGSYKNAACKALEKTYCTLCCNMFTCLKFYV